MDKLSRMRRHFSNDFKKEKVNLIEQGKISVSDICRTYEVSRTAVYQWLYKYGKKYSKNERVVIEKVSEEIKTLELMKKVAELERIIGQQQLQLIYKDSVIKCANDIYGEDIEKKYNYRQ